MNTNESFTSINFETFFSFNNYTEAVAQLAGQNKAPVDLIYHKTGIDFNVTFFKINNYEINSRVYAKYNITSIDFSSLKKAISIESFAKIIVSQWNIERPDGLTSQTEYKLYSNERTLPDLSKELILLSPHITNMTHPIISKALELQEIGINIYNQSSPFYNDV